MILVDTFVAGRPKTKGSMRVRNRATGAMEESVDGSGTWRALMAGAVKADYQARAADVLSVPGERLPVTGPVAVIAIFYLPVDPVQARAGDVDKLTRNLLDALASDARNPRYNGGVIVNDNQVVTLNVTKLGPMSLDAGCGVHIRVTTLQ